MTPATPNGAVPQAAATSSWDLVVVGAGPAGSAAALGALAARPDISVLLLDRAEFPRDKACGDGIAPHVLDVLETVGVTGLLDDLTPISEFSLWLGGEHVTRRMPRPVWVVPRLVFDHRLIEAAVRAGAVLHKRQVRTVDVSPDGVVVDQQSHAPIVVGADGAHSLVRSAAGMPAVRRRALALRGYAPTRPTWRDRQLIVFGAGRQLSYAWSFDCSNGFCNVGYGELLDPAGPPASKADLMAELEYLIPGATVDGSRWRGHHLPLSSPGWDHPSGRLLLAGDAAGLINPMTGEGIYYAVATGILAGRAAAAALSAGEPESAGVRYRRGVRRLLVRHLRHTAAASRLVTIPRVTSAGIRAAAGDQRIFDDLVELGLAQGTLTPRLVRGLLRHLVR